MKNLPLIAALLMVAGTGFAAQPPKTLSKTTPYTRIGRSNTQTVTIHGSAPVQGGYNLQTPVSPAATPVQTQAGFQSIQRLDGKDFKTTSNNAGQMPLGGVFLNQTDLNNRNKMLYNSNKKTSSQP